MLPVNGFGNLEYREFLKKFMSLMSSVSHHRCPQSSVSEQLQRPSTASRRSTPLLNCEDVEMKVHPRIQDCWRHIQRRCRQADPERTGEIDVDMFLSTFLSPLEFEQLAVKYDIKNSGRLLCSFHWNYCLGQCIEAMLRISRPIQLFWSQMRKVQYSVNLSEEEFFHFTFFDKNLSGRISYNDFLRIFLK
uniref:EF-hand domain-containing protein n=1 Tax=Sinocyclocheilus grahami TaxID=75366 RepID=A0A672K6A1_SINGR